MIIIFMFSYNWTNWFWHLMVHSFITVITSFWALGMEGGHNKAIESLKTSITYAQGPIAVGSFIMACLSILRFMIRWTMRVVCCCFGNNVYKCLCSCLQNIIQRYNEYVLTVVNLSDVGFFDASSILNSIFQRTGMSVITNEVAWSIPISVGTFCGYCASGGMGLVYHKATFANTTSDMKELEPFFFFFYAFLGGSVTAIGLAPLRSVLTTIFVIWSREPRSFAAGQPELYGELVTAIGKSSRLKSTIHESLVAGNKQVNV